MMLSYAQDLTALEAEFQKFHLRIRKNVKAPDVYVNSLRL